VAASPLIRAGIGPLPSLIATVGDGRVGVYGPTG
jgi:hypothetical protein